MEPKVFFRKAYRSLHFSCGYSWMFNRYQLLISIGCWTMMLPLSGKLFSDRFLL